MTAFPELDATGLGTLDVGDTATINMTTIDNNGDYVIPFSTLTTGKTVNVKIIDVQTSQLICDKDVRF